MRNVYILTVKSNGYQAECFVFRKWKKAHKEYLRQIEEYRPDETHIKEVFTDSVDMRRIRYETTKFYTQDESCEILLMKEEVIK